MIKKIFLFILIIFLALGGVYFKKNKTAFDSKKKLTFWSIQLKPVYEKQIYQIIAEFESKHPEYKVIWVDIPIQEAQKRTLASVLSSNPPDLINLNPDFSLVLAQKQALEFFNESALEQFSPELLNKLKYNNKIYALPFYATSSVTVYNKELYSKCMNKDFPLTYDELFLEAKELKACSNIPVFAASINENDTLAKILNKYNIYSLNSEIDKKQTEQVYSSFNEMYKKEYLPKDILTINHREVVEKYMSNQAMSVVVGSNFIKMIKQNAPDIYSKTALDKQLTGPNKKYDISLMNLIIPAKSQNKNLALEFALLLTNEKNQLELAKITNVLPANKYALNNEYFSSCPSDIVEASRCISAQQLLNIEEKDFGVKNKKEINEILNKTLEEILLDNNSNKKTVGKTVEKLAKQIKLLQE